MVGCRSRADVATLQRRDVETSRRGRHFLALIPIAPKLASTTALFTLVHLHPNQTPNQGSNHKNHIINIINIKKNVKMKDRREYSMSVLDTHQCFSQFDDDKDSPSLDGGFSAFIAVRLIRDN